MDGRVSSRSLSVGALVVVIVAALCGCATIASGPSQLVPVSSEPSDATVTIYDAAGTSVFTGRTPATATLQKGSGWFVPASYRVVVEKEGYDPRTVTVRGSVDVGWYVVGNFFLGGLIGWLIIDPVSGAMWTLAPPEIGGSLTTEASLGGGTTGLHVVLREDVPLLLAAHLVPLVVKAE